MSLKKIQKLPPQDYLNQLLDYNPETGEVVRKYLQHSVMSLFGWTERRVKIWNTRYAGKEAGHNFKSTSGGVLTQIRIDGKSYYLSRIIWKMVTGEDPDLVDHQDGDPQNNVWSNLRDTDNQGNCKNSKRFSTNTSGVTGVSWCKATGKWFSYIWDGYNRIDLGRYEDFDEAVKKRKEEEKSLEFHQNHGRVPLIHT